MILYLVIEILSATMGSLRALLACPSDPWQSGRSKRLVAYSSPWRIIQQPLRRSMPKIAKKAPDSDQFAHETHRNVTECAQ